MKLPNQRTVVLRKQEAPAVSPKPVKPVPKVKLGAEPDKARMLRNMTNPGIREAYATQRGKAMSPLDAKKVARSKATSEAARKFYGTSTRDRPKPAAKPQAKGLRTVVTPTGKGPAAEAGIRAKTKAAVRRAGGAKAVETQSGQKRIKQSPVMDTMSAKGRGPKTPMQRVDQKIMRNDYIRNNPTRVTSTQYGRAVRSSLTLRDAKAFLSTGKPQHTKGSFKSNKAANGIIRNARKYLSGRK
jgi:hypothetical protein